MFAPLPANKYDVVLLDPPWDYYGAQNKWAAAAKFYPTLSDAMLLKLDIQSLLHPKSVVFMWATCPRLDSAINLMKNYGLNFRGVAFVWVKTKKNGVPIGAQGVRPSIVKPLTELVLAGSYAKYGRPLALASEAVCQTVFAPKQEHSQKPDEVQERIETLYPAATKLELFARRTRVGWDSWGDELQ